MRLKSLKRINWFGVTAGILMLMLPFLGPWWRLRVGDGLAEIATSPFHISGSMMGKAISISSLVSYIVLATKITVLIAGVFMLLASLLPDRWWSRRLFKFGRMKVFWMVIGLVVMLVVAAAIANKVLPGFLPAGVQLSIPYVSGSTNVVVDMGDAQAIFPLSMGLGGAFIAAIVTAALCIAARIYNRRLVPPEEKKK